MLAKLKSSITKFHEDEAGLEALQVVMILAVAAICLIVLKVKWGDVKKWFEEKMTAAVGWD